MQWNHSFPKRLRQVIKPPAEHDHQFVFGWTDGQIRSEHVMFCTRETIDKILKVIDELQREAKR